MTPLTLVARLQRAGVRVSPRGAHLGYDAPAGAMTPGVRAALVARKPEVMAVLRRPGAAAFASLLSRVAAGDVRDDLAVRFEELAGTLEYDAGLSRDEAEEEACCQLFVALERAAEGTRQEPLDHA